MSRREVKFLTTDPGHVICTSRLRGEQSRTMSGEEQLSAEVERLTEEITTAREEAGTLKEEARRLAHALEEAMKAKEEAECRAARMDEQLREMDIHAELDRLRAMEQLRDEHQRALNREQQLTDYERDLNRVLTEEKRDLQRKLELLRVDLSHQEDLVSRPDYTTNNKILNRY